MRKTRCGCLMTSSLWMESKTMRYSALTPMCHPLVSSSYHSLHHACVFSSHTNRPTRSLSCSLRSPTNGSPTMPQRETPFSSRFGRSCLNFLSLSFLVFTRKSFIHECLFSTAQHQVPRQPSTVSEDHLPSPARSRHEEYSIS